jgi:hypothetical protein
MTANFKYKKENKPKPLSVRIPAWVENIDEIATANKLDGDRMRVLLHQFFLSYLKNSKLRSGKAGRNFLPEYFPVRSLLLRQTCTDNYIKYVNALIAAGVIEKRNYDSGKQSYVVGGHAQLYRWMIPNTYYGGYSFRKEIVSAQKSVNAVLRTRDKYVKENNKNALELAKSNPAYIDMLDYFNDLVIIEPGQDEVSAHQITSDLKFLECELLANGDLSWFTMDDFGHRLHHPVATMPKDYRKYLRFKEYLDQPLAVLDVRNSQPYWSSVILNKDLINAYLPEFIPLLEHIIRFERKPDLLLYRKLCVEGRLYEFLMEGMGLSTKDHETSHKIRDDFKVLFFSSILYSKTRVFGEKSRFRDSFRMQFPNVHAMFQTIKSMDETILPELKHIICPAGKKFKHKNSNDAHKVFPCMMQRIESVMMFQVIAPKLIDAGIRFVTVHDSFILLPQDVDQALKIVRNSFENLGIPAPTIS